MEFYKRIPKNGYKDAGYHHGELCSNCGHNEYEDVLHNTPLRKKKIKIYERHCPSCHCPSERQRFSPSNRSKTSENVKAMLNRYERVPSEPISSTIKKSQSSPLSQNIYWHDYQTNTHSRCPKGLLQACRQRRSECDKYSPSVFRMQGDAANSEFTNEDVETYCRYTQSTVPIKSSLKKYDRCREPEVSPDGQEYSDVDSEVSMKRGQYIQSKKPHMSNLDPRSHYVGGDDEYVTETRNESDVGCRQNERECQDVKRPLELGDLEKLKRDSASMINENDKENERQKLDAAKTIKSTNSEASCCRTRKPSVLKESIDKSARELVLDGPALMAKLDLNTTKNRIIESIDQMLNTMDDAKNDTPQQQERTEQETVEKIAHELQENGWQLLFNALMIHRDSTDSSKRTVRLECLNHIRQQLDKLYALESTLDNCPPNLRSLSSHNMLCNEEHQQSRRLEQKIVDS